MNDPDHFFGVRLVSSNRRGDRGVLAGLGQKKMTDMQDVPDRALGIIGLLFIASGVVVAGLSDGIIKIAAIAVALEGTLYGFLPTLMKRVMAAAVQCSESMLKVWGETALGIGAAALALFY